MSGLFGVEDRIASVIRLHEFDAVYDLNYSGRCAYRSSGYACDWRGTADEHPAHVAGEVAKALQLEEEWRVVTDMGVKSNAGSEKWARALAQRYDDMTLQVHSVSSWVSVPQEEQ